MENEKLCDNCNVRITEQNYTTHVLHCKRHIKLCNYCGQPIPRESMDDHFETEHANVKCAGCGIIMEKSLLEIHMQEDCPKRTIVCQFCELELPACDMDEHIEYCGAQTEKCSDCGEYVMLKYRQLHLDSNHNFLKLEDEPGPVPSWKKESAGAATANIRSPDVPKTDDCSLPCEFCQEMFTPKELRRHQVSCLNGWRTSVPRLRLTSTIVCITCGKPIFLKEYEDHRAICSDSSLECRSLLDKSTLIPCDVCNKSIAFEEYSRHSRLCSFKGLLPPRTRDSDNTEARNKEAEKNLLSEQHEQSIASRTYDTAHFQSPRANRPTGCSSTYDTSLKSPCEYCKQLFHNSRLGIHRRSCARRDHQVPTIPCELCGELRPVHDIMEHQLTCQTVGYLKL